MKIIEIAENKYKIRPHPIQLLRLFFVLGVFVLIIAPNIISLKILDFSFYRLLMFGVWVIIAVIIALTIKFIYIEKDLLIIKYAGILTRKIPINEIVKIVYLGSFMSFDSNNDVHVEVKGFKKYNIGKAPSKDDERDIFLKKFRHLLKNKELDYIT